jgi:hypothetical protein
MKKLFATLIAGLFAAVTFSAFAADPAPATTDKPAVHKKHAKKHHKKDMVPAKPADTTKQ